jgi:hypothetical protein
LVIKAEAAQAGVDVGPSVAFGGKLATAGFSRSRGEGEVKVKEA